MPPSQLHDRLLQGDQSAFEEIFGDLNPILLRVAVSITGNRATAEEVTQDAWLSVIENLQSYKGDAPLRHWILKILSNKARSRATRDGKTETLDLEDSGSRVSQNMFTESGNWAVAPALWDEITPERVLAGRQSLQLVREAIQRLPPSQQAILTLLEQEKMSANACAVLLGISPANVRVQLHRAREKIRQVLDEELRTEN